MSENSGILPQTMASGSDVMNSSTFTATKDRFSCIMIDTSRENFKNDKDFEQKLLASVDKWIAEKIRGLWIKISPQHSSVIPLCLEAGFVFHHAQKGYLMMKRWLSSTENDTLPDFASHYVGCAGFVVNELDQVLVVKEKYSAKHCRWKFPGGMANPNEDIPEAAKREVFEETGIECEFVGMLTYRQQHQFRWGCSDLYFICLMKAKTTQITMCQSEISACKWMHIEEYLQQNITDQNRYAAQCYLNLKDNSEKGMIGITQMMNYCKTAYQPVYSVLANGLHN